MENQAKIRINLNTKEMEIQGSEEFIEKYSTDIRKFLENQPAKRGPGRPPKTETENAATTRNVKPGPKRKRGRPKKSEDVETTTASASPTTKKKVAGKTAKKTTAKKAAAMKTKAAPAKRKARRKSAKSATVSKKSELEKMLSSVTQEQVDALKQNLPARFGDFFLNLPKETKDVDKVLTGGFFVQQNGANDTFSTRETTRLLKTVGVKLSNPSQCVKYNDKTGRIKNVRRNRYRLTPLGEKYIVYLLSRKNG